IDGSAVIAIWRKEPQADMVRNRLTAEPENERRISAATYIETGAVLAGGSPIQPLGIVAEFDDWLAEFSVELVPLDAEQARIALDARIRFGRGFRAPAKLNLGDCFSYALAKALKAPLLYVGEDFDKTDIRPALRRRKTKGKKP